MATLDAERRWSIAIAKQIYQLLDINKQNK